MNVKWSWRFGAILVGCLALAGCEGPSHEPTELSEQLQREIKLVAPTVGGPTKEFSVPEKPVDIASAVEGVLKDAGVHLVRTGRTAQGQWLLGKSLADRSVLVQILPVYPGRSTVKVTVEGGDNLARTLLDHLSSGISKKVQ